MLARHHLSIALIAFLFGTSTTLAACPEPKELDMSIMLLNFQGPLVSPQLAEDMAAAFFRARYPSSLFQARLPGTTTDLGDRWKVMFENINYDSTIELTKRIPVQRLSVEICKSNAAIVRIT
jgi:hypothetical protein